MCKFQIAALSLHFEHLRETKGKAVTKVFGPSAQSCGATRRGMAQVARYLPMSTA